MYGTRTLAASRAVLRALPIATQPVPPLAASTSRPSSSADVRRAFGSSLSRAEGSNDSAGSPSKRTEQAQLRDQQGKPTKGDSSSKRHHTKEDVLIRPDADISKKSKRKKRAQKAQPSDVRHIASGKSHDRGHQGAPASSALGSQSRNFKLSASSQKPQNWTSNYKPKPSGSSYKPQPSGSSYKSQPSGSSYKSKPSLEGERYFGIWPQSSLEPLVQGILSSTLASTELADPVRQAIEAELAQFPARHATDADLYPRVVVMHNLDLKRAKADEAVSAVWQAIWDKFKVMADRPDSPDYQLAFDYLVFDDSAMSLTVTHCNPRADDPLAAGEEINFWALPAGSESRFSLTVLNPPVRPSKDPKRLEYAPNLATVFRHHLSLNPAKAELAAGTFEQNSFKGTFVKLDNVSIVGKFAPKLFNDTVFRKYSCPVPRQAPVAPIGAVQPKGKDLLPHQPDLKTDLPRSEELKEAKE